MEMQRLGYFSAFKNSIMRKLILFMHTSLDGFWLFVNPVLLGKGIPLFSNVENERKLGLLSSHVFSSGVIALHYECVRS